MALRRVSFSSGVRRGGRRCAQDTRQGGGVNGVESSGNADRNAEEEDGRGSLCRLSNFRALVLDVAFQPIDVVNWQRAVCMDIFGRADVLEYYNDVVRTPNAAFPLPAVVKVRYYVKDGRSKGGRVALSRRNVLIRDEHTCQYCGRRDHLTIDHVWPQSKGGPWSWDNLVTACEACNSKKGCKTLEQCGMKLRKPPVEPPTSQIARYVRLGFGPEPPSEWEFYLPVERESVASSRQVESDAAKYEV